ncbi:MAG: hypothetical protein EA397_07900 [Deltaproteobacteria bacterium]|nr:MAG: hypothetical protein EA397_07900 [Deltaproteobacteria bacterium]
MTRLTPALLLLFLAACGERDWNVNANGGGGISTPVVALSPDQPRTNDRIIVEIQNEDAVRYVYSWTRDGQPVAEATSDLVQPDLTAKGERWEVLVTAHRGEASSSPGSAAVTIQNTPPEVEIRWADDSPTVLDDLEVLATSTDLDEDPVQLSYTWTANGTPVAHAGSVLPAAQTTIGDVWTVTVTPSDNEAAGESKTLSTEIGSAGPYVLSVTLSPNPAYTDTSVTVSADAVHPDDEPFTLTYAWEINGSSHTASGATLNASNFVKGDVLVASVSANDGGRASPPVASDPLVIDNSAPERPVPPVITPSFPNSESDLTCTLGAEVHDPDGDPLTYEFAWFRGGSLYSSHETADTSHTLPFSATSEGDVWYCRVRAIDDEGLDSLWSPDSFSREIRAMGSGCVVVEDWDSGSWGPGWTNTSGTISAAHAHDGGLGVSDPDWARNFTEPFQTGFPPERIQVWTRGGTGRTYLGFHATSGGARSLVLAQNTNVVMFQNNSSWSYTNLSSTAFTPVTGRWYLMEVEFEDTRAIGRVYDSDGASLLREVTHDFGHSLVGGIALRSFGGISIDSLTICY